MSGRISSGSSIGTSMSVNVSRGTGTGTSMSINGGTGTPTGIGTSPPVGTGTSPSKPIVGYMVGARLDVSVNEKKKKKLHKMI